MAQPKLKFLFLSAVMLLVSLLVSGAARADESAGLDILRSGTPAAGAASAAVARALDDADINEFVASVVSDIERHREELVKRLAEDKNLRHILPISSDRVRTPGREFESGARHFAYETRDVANSVDIAACYSEGRNDSPFYGVYAISSDEARREYNVRGLAPENSGTVLLLQCQGRMLEHRDSLDQVNPKDEATHLVTLFLEVQPQQALSDCTNFERMKARYVRSLNGNTTSSPVRSFAGNIAANFNTFVDTCKNSITTESFVTGEDSQIRIRKVEERVHAVASREEARKLSRQRGGLPEFVYFDPREELQRYCDGGIVGSGCTRETLGAVAPSRGVIRESDVRKPAGRLITGRDLIRNPQDLGRRRDDALGGRTPGRSLLLRSN